MKGPIVFVDIETGGLQPYHPIIQIGAIAVDAWEEVGIFEAKIQFDKGKADPKALEINHFSQDDWTHAIPTNEAIAQFAAFLNKHESVSQKSKRTGKNFKVARIAGHNVQRFDAPRLRDAFKAAGVFFPAHPQTLDTMHLALWYAHAANRVSASFTLETLAQGFGIPTEGAHDALTDCRITIAVAKRLLELLAK